MRELIGIETEITWDNMDVIQALIDSHEWTVATIENNIAFLESVITFLDRTHKEDDAGDTLTYLKNALMITDKKNRLRYSAALQRFVKAYTTKNYYDSILDLCASLEGVLQINDELRLRLALSVYYLTKNKRIMNDIYHLYKFRNDYIHNDIKNELNENDYSSLKEACRSVLIWPLINGTFFNKADIDKNILNF